jgi:hypothetical protein
MRRRLIRPDYVGPTYVIIFVSVLVVLIKVLS